MTTIHPEELLALWQNQRLTVEAAVGQLLENVVRLQTAIEAANLSRAHLRSDIDRLLAQARLTSAGGALDQAEDQAARKG
ncbi:MAG TPA: hypothetical protein PKE64_08130 [Anaerolineae bacterium]|nr:hypothetical protein [Anaerolineae bacterium]HMR63961.1 hypothetical protein [Anaerolineae bacterium]